MTTLSIIKFPIDMRMNTTICCASVSCDTGKVTRPVTVIPDAAMNRQSIYAMLEFPRIP